MRVTGLMIGVVAAAALAGTASVASAQTRADADEPAPSVASNLVAGEDARQSALQWNENGRWGLNLRLNQPVGRATDWSDVQAGAYYRLNPRLRVGAAASLAEPQADPARPAETDRRAQPRVRLETIFRF